MSTYEQQQEPVDEKYQYLLIAAEPYQVIAFKVPSAPIKFINKSDLFTQWDNQAKQYRIQLEYMWIGCDNKRGQLWNDKSSNFYSKTLLELSMLKCIL